MGLDFIAIADILAREYATECLKKDRTELLEFFNFPAEHWQHIRTTNPIESTFATGAYDQAGRALRDIDPNCVLQPSPEIKNHLTY